MTQLSTRPASPVFSIPSVLALAAAIGSFATGTPGWRLILAIVAIVFGAIGFLLSLSPAKRGGIVSILSIVIAALAVIVALFQIIGRIAF